MSINIFYDIIYKYFHESVYLYIIINDLYHLMIYINDIEINAND